MLNLLLVVKSLNIFERQAYLKYNQLKLHKSPYFLWYTPLPDACEI